MGKGRWAAAQHSGSSDQQACPSPQALASAQQSSLSGRVRETAPSHRHSWGKIPSISSLYLLLQVERGRRQYSSPSGKHTVPEPECQPSLTFLLLSRACPAPSSQLSLPGRQPLTWEPALATWSGMFLPWRRHGRLESRVASSRLSALTGPETCSSHSYQLTDRCWGTGIIFPKGGLFHSLSWRKRDTGLVLLPPSL